MLLYTPQRIPSAPHLARFSQDVGYHSSRPARFRLPMEGRDVGDPGSVAISTGKSGGSAAEGPAVQQTFLGNDGT